MHCLDYRKPEDWYCALSSLYEARGLVLCVSYLYEARCWYYVCLVYRMPDVGTMCV